MPNTAILFQLKAPVRARWGRHPGLTQWEALTQGARQAQADHRFEHALAGHVRALWTVEGLLEASVLRAYPEDCLAALVVSHHNLADVYRRRGQWRAAVEHLCAPHELLLRLAGDGSTTVQQAAWRHLRETRAALIAWQHAHGNHARIDDCVQQWSRAGGEGQLAYRH